MFFKLFRKGMTVGFGEPDDSRVEKKRIIVSSMYIVHIGSAVPLNKLSR